MTGNTVTLRINAGASAQYLWPSKDPVDTTAYYLDATDWLAAQGATLVGAVVSGDPTIVIRGWAFVLSAAAYTGMSFLISGGVSGTMPSVSVRLSLLDGSGMPKNAVVTIVLPILGTQPSGLTLVSPTGGSAIADGTGAVLVDGAGHPIFPTYGPDVLTDGSGLVPTDSFGNQIALIYT